MAIEDIQRVPVMSSNVASVGYDPETATLEIEFHSGSVYHYHGVAQTTFDDLISAGSVGKYLHQYIKNVYGYTRIM